jgi:hypothetical protein
MAGTRGLVNKRGSMPTLLNAINPLISRPHSQASRLGYDRPDMKSLSILSASALLVPFALGVFSRHAFVKKIGELNRIETHGLHKE